MNFGFKNTLSATVYAATPVVLTIWVVPLLVNIVLPTTSQIPGLVLGVAFGFWSLLIQVYGLSNQHGISGMRAPGAIFIPGIIFAVIVSVLAFFWITGVFQEARGLVDESGHLTVSSEQALTDDFAACATSVLLVNSVSQFSITVSNAGSRELTDIKVMNVTNDEIDNINRLSPGEAVEIFWSRGLFDNFIFAEGLCMDQFVVVGSCSSQQSCWVNE